MHCGCTRPIQVLFENEALYSEGLLGMTRIIDDECIVAPDDFILPLNGRYFCGGDIDEEC